MNIALLGRSLARQAASRGMGRNQRRLARHRKLCFEREEERNLLTLPEMTLDISSPVDEGGALNLVVGLSHPSDVVVSVNLTITHAEGGAGGDDWPFSSTSIWLAP